MRWGHDVGWSGWSCSSWGRLAWNNLLIGSTAAYSMTLCCTISWTNILVQYCVRHVVLWMVQTVTWLTRQIIRFSPSRNITLWFIAGKRFSGVDLSQESHDNGKADWNVDSCEWFSIQFVPSWKIFTLWVSVGQRFTSQLMFHPLAHSCDKTWKKKSFSKNRFLFSKEPALLAKVQLGLFETVRCGY